MKGEPVSFHSVYEAFCTFSYPTSLRAGLYASCKRYQPRGVDVRRHLTWRRLCGANLYTAPTPHPPFPGEVVTLHASRFLVSLSAGWPSHQAQWTLTRFVEDFSFYFFFLLSTCCIQLRSRRFKGPVLLLLFPSSLGLLSHETPSMSIPSDSVQPWHELITLTWTEISEKIKKKKMKQPCWTCCNVS